MAKTLLYLFLAVLLVGGAWYFLFYNKDDAFAGDGNFSVNDTATVGKIFMVTTSGAGITLTRDSAGWMVNNRYRAAQSPVRTLLKTLNLQQVQSTVPLQQRERVIKALAGNAIKTEVYDLNGRRLRSFFVGNEAPGFTGTYMLEEGSEMPYAVGITGFNGYLTPRYSTDVKAWRDHTIIAVPSSAIKSLSITYPAAPQSNFTISRTGADSTALLVTGAPEMALAGKPLNVKRVLSYLRLYKAVYCEAFSDGISGLSATLGRMPQVATITLQPATGKGQQVVAYRMPINKRSKNLDVITGTELDNYDGDRLYAVYNNAQDTAIIQYRDFNKLLRRSYEFFEQDSVIKPEAKGSFF